MKLFLQLRLLVACFCAGVFVYTLDNPVLAGINLATTIYNLGSFAHGVINDE